MFIFMQTRVFRNEMQIHIEKIIHVFSAQKCRGRPEESRSQDWKQHVKKFRSKRRVQENLILQRGGL